MRRGLALGMAGLIVALACDDAHKVGDDIGVGGGGRATGGKSARGGGGGATQPSQAGTAGAASVLDATCTWPTAAFEFKVDDPSKYCVSGLVHDAPIQILTVDGKNVSQLGFTGCIETRCDSCTSRGCIAIAPSQSEVTGTPRTEVWDGSSDTMSSCGAPSMSCRTAHCVEPGRYIAKYCLAPKGDLSTCQESDSSKFIPATACVEVPFDFPTTGVVRGQIATPRTDGTAGTSGAGGSAGAGGAVGTGGVATGETAGASGAAGGPSIVDETCTWPTAHFEFTVDDPSLYCYSPDFVTPWYTQGGIRILTAAGQAVTNLGAKDMGTYEFEVAWPRCATCPITNSNFDPVGQRQVTSEPRTGTWNGGFDIAGTCGSPSMICYANHCVQPGKFIAKYCVVPKGARSTCNVTAPGYGRDETACVEVPFDFPTTEVVRGQITQTTIPPSTGGAAGAGGSAGSASAGVVGNGGTAGSSS